MKAILVVVALTLGGADVESSTPVEQVQAACETGSLIVSRGDCLAIRVFTASSYTHVATVVEHDDQKIVYDSMNGTGVRCLPLKDYLRVQSPDEVHLFHPKRSFRPEEVQRFEDYLNAQIGRPYAVAHHVTGKRVKGVHCAEYVTDALIEVDWLKANNPVRVSPASLVDGITNSNVYLSGETIELPFDTEPIPEPTGRCARWWENTKYCVKSCGSKLSGWVLCR